MAGTLTSKFRLTKLTTLTRVNGTETVNKAPGAEVNYARTETPTATVHRVWVIEDGYLYEASEVMVKGPHNATPTQPRVFTDGRGKSVTSALSHEAALQQVVGAGNDHYNWILYWIHEYAARAARDRADREEREKRDAEARANAGQVEGLDMGKSLRFISDMFVLAVGRGLKTPMIRLHFGMRRYKLYLSRRGTVCLKSGALVEDAKAGCRKPAGDEEYMGCFLTHNFLQARIDRPNQHAGGRYRWYRYWGSNYSEGSRYRSDDDRPVRPFAEGEAEFLRRLAEDPVGFFLECSRDMDRCCFCGKALEDARSKLVGCGKVCADRWGIKWGDDSRTEQVPSFAEVYQRGGDLIAGFCTAIRENPQDAFNWLAFSDYLMDECGMPVGVKMPEGRNPLMPRESSIAKT